MEQKKSNLFFVKDHNSFDDEGIEFKLEMLAWPIYEYGGEKIVLKPFRNVIKEALFAVMELDPFTVKISLDVDIENQRLILTKRMWGNIYLKDTVVVPFTHDSRNSDAAFVTVMDWTEIMNLGSWTEYEGRTQEFRKVLDWSSRENWKQFFKNRIAQSYITLMENAVDAMEKAAWNAKIALIIKSCLENVV